jgi:hypothetical protein
VVYRNSNTSNCPALSLLSTPGAPHLARFREMGDTTTLNILLLIVQETPEAYAVRIWTELPASAAAAARIR